MIPRPYQTWDRKALLDAYSSESDPETRRDITKELDLRKREAVAPPKRKPFAAGWTGHNHGTRAAGEHRQQ
jgi:hypothetical protein